MVAFLQVQYSIVVGSDQKVYLSGVLGTLEILRWLRMTDGIASSSSFTSFRTSLAMIEGGAKTMVS